MGVLLSCPGRWLPVQALLCSVETHRVLHRNRPGGSLVRRGGLKPAGGTHEGERAGEGMHDSQARRASDAGNCRIDEGNMPKRKLARAARI